MRLVQDIRYGLRLLRKQPGFAVIAVATLALGIGATTALFSLVNTALLRPLHAERPAELVTAFNGGADASGTSNHAYPDYLDLRNGGAGVFTGLAAFTTRPANLMAGMGTERINVGLITDNYFRVLGVRPIAGRDFASGDNSAPGAHPVALISEARWRRDFGGRAHLGDASVC